MTCWPLGAKQGAAQLVRGEDSQCRASDDDARRRIGDDGRRHGIGCGGQRERQGSDHRIAGARDVEHLADLRRDVAGIERVDDTDAFLAARRDQIVEAVGVDQLACSRGDLLVAEHRPAHRLAKLLAIGGHGGRTGICREIPVLRIDQHRLAGATADGDQIGRDAIEENTLAVVGQHRDVGTGQRLAETIHQRR